jgi:hypothetical protein
MQEMRCVRLSLLKVTSPTGCLCLPATEGPASGRASWTGDKRRVAGLLWSSQLTLPSFLLAVLPLQFC